MAERVRRRAPACVRAGPRRGSPMFTWRLPRIRVGEHRGRLRRRGRRASASRIAGSLRAEDGRGEQRRVDRARLADRQRADRDAARHLHDREQRVDALQRRRLDRHAEHRQHRLGRRHARQMRRAARAGDDHLEAARLGAAGVLEEQVGRAVRRDDADLVRHAELLERLGRVPHGLPVGPGAHDDADQRVHRSRITRA